MIQDCPKCGDPVMSEAAQCAKCGFVMPGHGAPVSAKDRTAASDAALEKSLLLLGLFSAFQVVKIFMARDAEPWVQVARGILGVLGAVFLYVSQAKDVAALSASAKLALRLAMGVAVLLLLAAWLS